MCGTPVHPNGRFLLQCQLHNYDQEFEVVGEPYDYGLPGSVYVKFSDEKGVTNHGA